MLYSESKWVVSRLSTDALHMQIDRLETKVVKPLVEYDSVCRKARVSFTFEHGPCVP